MIQIEGMPRSGSKTVKLVYLNAGVELQAQGADGMYYPLVGLQDNGTAMKGSMPQALLDAGWQKDTQGFFSFEN